MQLPGFQNLFDQASLALGLSALVKLGIGALLAGIVGFERELHGRPAGLRTHILIALGVILFTEVSRAFAPNDPARIAAQIITGIGFLGAGSILRIGVEVKGLTTAASIWAVAAIGMAVSTGGPMLWVAVVATIFTLITLAVVDNLERALVPHGHARNVQVHLERDADLASVVSAAQESGCETLGVKIVSNKDPRVVVLSIRRATPDILGKLAATSGVVSADFTE